MKCFDLRAYLYVVGRPTMSKLFLIEVSDVISIRHKRTHILYLVRNAPRHVLFSFFSKHRFPRSGRCNRNYASYQGESISSFLSFFFTIKRRVRLTRLAIGFKFLRSNRTRELFGQRLRLFVFRRYEGKFPDTLLNPFAVLRPM